MNRKTKNSLLKLLVLSAVLAFAVVACDFEPTTSFDGFDGETRSGIIDVEGATLQGTFQSGHGRTGHGVRAQRAFTEVSSVDDLKTVYVFDPDGLGTDYQLVSGEVVPTAEAIGSAPIDNGSFTLRGLPDSFLLVFADKDDIMVGEYMEFEDVKPNQQIDIVVGLTANGEVELLEESRTDIDGCLARGDGFWCNNPPDDFEEFADAVALDFEGLTMEEDGMVVQFFDLDGDDDVDRDDIALAVCLTGNQDGTNQLLRKMATTALNLEAGWFGDDGALKDAAIDALDAAIGVLEDPLATKTDRDSKKDDLEALNECGEVVDDDTDDGDDTGTVDGCEPEPGSNKITICHKPQGNNPRTLSISPSAWPAHQAHGDDCGACTT